MNTKYPLYIILCILIGTIVSCNSSDDTEPVVYSSSVAVKTFTLTEDDSVLANLDSVFFTIDLNSREIYNADSLPKGTKVTKLIPNITYPLVYSAMLHIKGGEVMKDTTINYATNSTDSIDFTGNVTLELVSEDETQTATYTIKVNVHNIEPDSLYWNQMARRDLPSYTTPLQQKTVDFNNNVVCLVKEANQYVISTNSNPGTERWSTQVANFTFTPNVSSLTATDNLLYILSDNNELYSSADGESWSTCNANMVSLLGGYGEALEGIVLKDNGYFYAEFAGNTLTVKSGADENFPIFNTSSPVVFESKWSTSSQMIIFGGTTKAGNAVGDTWGFDGTQWGQLNARPMPAISNAVLVPYFTYKVSTKWVATKYATLIAIGGFADGKPSSTVYISYDYGVNWKVADDLLQLPSYIPAFGNAQGVVVPVEMSARSMNDEWKNYGSKELPVWCTLASQNFARSYDISWECPYIYLFGGTDNQGYLYNNIWRGVLNRLSFKPLI